MLKKLLLFFSLALQNVRSRLFHTLLSILGIVIGVAALVAILSMIDGMEKYAQKQINKTTSINSLLIQSDPYKVVNDVRLKKDTFAILDYTTFNRLKATLTQPVTTYLFVRQSAAYTWNTLFIISIVAVLVGIIFGTYPALRAARLDPVEAIRRE